MLPEVDPLATVVVCEDDEPTLELLCDHLTADRYRALPAPCASDALRLCHFEAPDLLLLDLRLPDASGLDVLREIRGADGSNGRFDPGLAIVVLSGRGSPADRTRGLNEGADDYVVKPFAYDELVARVRAVLRRRASRREGPRRIGELSIDPATREVRVAGRSVELAQQGVRPAAGAGVGADAGVLEAGAAARRVELPLAGEDPDAGLTRQPAAAKARPRGRAVRRQLLGCRATAWSSRERDRARARRRVAGGVRRWPRSRSATAPAGRGGGGRSTRRCTSCAARCRRWRCSHTPSAEAGSRTRDPRSARAGPGGARRPRSRGEWGTPRRRCARSRAARGRGSLARWREAAGRRGAAIELRWLAGPAIVLADPRRLAQAIDNLVANAIEHAAPPVAIEVTLAAGRVRIAVRDGGPPESAPGIGAAKATLAGLGLIRSRGRDGRRGHGLAVVARIASEHGGRFMVRRGEGGTVAALELPLARADPASVPLRAA